MTSQIKKTETLRDEKNNFSLKTELDEIISLLKTKSSTSFWSKSPTETERAMLKLGQVISKLNQGKYSLDNLAMGAPSISDFNEKFKGREIEEKIKNLQGAFDVNVRLKTPMSPAPSQLITLG